ncbi:DUF3278 domain-containing protein [Aquibacillus saliphilus]|uniref:DUF3278 domain-containing protein n=1 Tax=Aquibacillus saliphilus TaxID=1909422 RepID=UPI001CF0A9D5|nr:DUF3278 domain-containing protein [Aquibacillus saliphilus]
MKSWISFLLPNDEYKEKRMLYFFAEGGIILFLSLIIMIICNGFFNLDIETALLVSIGIFLFYVSGRYIISGIEYTDIATEHTYKKEIKHIFSRTCSFVVIFMLLYLMVDGVPSNKDEWITIIGLLLSVSLLWFFTSYLSLKRSYNKNKQLL